MAAIFSLEEYKRPGFFRRHSESYANYVEAKERFYEHDENRKTKLLWKLPIIKGIKAKEAKKLEIECTRWTTYNNAFANLYYSTLSLNDGAEDLLRNSDEVLYPDLNQLLMDRDDLKSSIKSEGEKINNDIVGYETLMNQKEGVDPDVKYNKIVDAIKKDKELFIDDVIPTIMGVTDIMLNSQASGTGDGLVLEQGKDNDLGMGYN
ncbi:MAG: hypothetical protein N4A47_04065 [Clostridia bacterium]|nr:hypothetical protein [Clostridia bacterium]